MMHAGAAALTAAVILTISLAGEAIAEECIDGAQMTISGTISSIKRQESGALDILLTESAGCEIWGVAAEKTVVPPECRAGRQIEATGLLDSFMGYIAVLQAETISCD
jgi:hypothetical protein